MEAIGAGLLVGEKKACRGGHNGEVLRKESAVAGDEVLLPDPERDFGAGGEGTGVVVGSRVRVAIEATGLAGGLSPRLILDAGAVEAHGLRHAGAGAAVHAFAGPLLNGGEVLAIEAEVGEVELGRPAERLAATCMRRFQCQ